MEDIDLKWRGRYGTRDDATAGASPQEPDELDEFMTTIR